MGEHTPVLLDRFYIEDRLGRLYVVVGNRHPPGAAYAYMKYAPTRGKSIWCRGGTCYERLVPTYSPRIVHERAYMRLYDPYYDARIPAIPLGMASIVYDPRRRLREIITRPRDSLEEDAGLYAVELARAAGVQLGCIGVTGSLLPGIHNVWASDIDYVVYGARCCEKVVETLSSGSAGGFRAFPRRKLAEWITRLTRVLGVDQLSILQAYRAWRRGVLAPGSREYSISYSLGFSEGYTGSACATTGVARIRALVEGGPRTLNYPSEASVRRYRIIYGSPAVRSRITRIVSFESFYMPLLYEGGWVIVEGIVQQCMPEGFSRILVGVSEHKGYITPAT